MKKTLTDDDIKRIVVNLSHNITGWLDTALPKGQCTLGEVYLIVGWAFYRTMDEATFLAGLFGDNESKPETDHSQ